MKTLLAKGLAALIISLGFLFAFLWLCDEPFGKAHEAFTVGGAVVSAVSSFVSAFVFVTELAAS